MKRKKGLIRPTPGDRIFQVGVQLYLLVSFLLVAYPLIYILSASFSDVRAVTSGRVWLWPVDFSLEAYRTVFESKNIVSGYLNSLYYTALGTAVNVAMTLMAAYPLSRRDLKGRAGLSWLFSFTMLFSGGMIPGYMLVSKLDLINTVWALVLPGAISAWNMIIMRTYFQTSIPEELYEAASLDGCSDIRFLLRIVLPLSGPIVAVITLYYAVGHWNSYFNPMLYLTDAAKYPLQMVLREILILGQMESDMMRAMDAERFRQGLGQLLKYAVIVVSSVPVLIVYLFVQKHFVKGVMIGAIKG